MRLAADNIAIVKLGAIGDAVNALPFVNRLREGFPRARITWIIGPAAHALLAGHPAVDEFLLFEKSAPRRWIRFVRDLRARRFDLVVDLQRISKSGLIALASGSGRRLGFDRARAKEASWLATNLRIPANPRPGVTVEQYLEFADFLELPRTAPEWRLPRVPPPAGSLRARPVVVNLGASKPANRWYADKWAALCTRLVRELDAHVHLTGGREDRATAERVLAGLDVAVEDRVGRLTLPESAGLIAASELFVGCDTGPLHIAAAVGTPAIALFGAADPARTGPFGEHAVLSRPTPCAPCRRRHCHVAGHPCMSLLDEELVFAEARRVLGRAHAARASGSHGVR